MENTKKRGEAGEDIAAHYLQRQAYVIAERNWRAGRAEIDIIARQGEALIFVEVKTRSSIRFGSPETFVTERKERLIAQAAQAYMEAVQHDWEIRFDIIAIVIHPDGSHELQHFEDAFFPGLH